MGKDTTIHTSVKEGCVRISLREPDGKHMAVLIVPAAARVIAKSMLECAQAADAQMPEAP